jgi:hypothetical protein
MPLLIYVDGDDVEWLFKHNGGDQYDWEPVNVIGATGDTGDTGGDGDQGDDGGQGIPGPTGPQGPIGATGAQGPQGLTGETGPQGEQGPPGADGVDGEDGADGSTGPQGIQGIPGADGADGSDGADGDTGPQGEQGIQGATGPQGIQGLTGPQGAQGIQGETGATGATGAQGIQGVPGADGLDGEDGADGATGAQGIQGIQGIQGPAGNTGADGAAGAAGATGPTGPAPSGTGFVKVISGVLQVPSAAIAQADVTSLVSDLAAKAASSSLATVATSGSASDLGTGTLPIARIAAGAVTLAKLANVGAASILGSVAGGTPAELTGTQVTTLLDVRTETLKGLMPANMGRKASLATNKSIANTLTQVVGFTAAANTLAVGTTIRFRGMGLLTNTTSASTSVLTLRINSASLGSTIEASWSVALGTTARTNCPFIVEGELIVISTGAGGTAWGVIVVTVNTTTAIAVPTSMITGAVTCITTQSNVVELTCVSGAASTTWNFISATIEVVNP